ncbi:hypothetical protein [Micromonospora globispora]|nr:hypothetical protein [Micromonospora globispora]
MWIPVDVVVLAVGTAVFLRWLRRLERAMPSGPDVEPQDRVVPLEEIKP